MSMSRRAAAAVLGAGALIGLIVVPASPAIAHDQLLSSTPAVAERLAVAPTEVVLQFSDDVLTVGALLLVVDAQGKDWAAADAVYDGPAVRASIDGDLPEAGYEIRWRAVSSDGHPVSGLIPFTVGDGEPYSSIAPDGSTATDEGSQTPQSADAGTGDGLLRIGLIGLGGAVLALGLFATFEIIMRRRARATPGRSDASGPQAT